MSEIGDPGAEPKTRGRLLVVDDVADNREILRRRLERRGFQVFEADGGVQALERFEAEVFDLVLLDVMMPDLNGLEVLRRIRTRQGPVLMPVIMVTAKADSDDIVQALKLGANDYVTKPVDFAVMFARVEAHVARKRTEEDLVQAHQALQAKMVELQGSMEAAEAGNRARDAFLANMSHEIRTPLNGVMAIAEVLARTPLNPEQSGLVEIITSSAHSLERVLSDVLDRARVESGTVELREEAFDLEEAVTAAAGLCRASAERKKLGFTVTVEEAARGQVFGDAVRLKQVLTNLLSNACKFTEHGEVSLTVRRSDEGYRFEVRDTGIGLPADMTERIFGRFIQADESVTRRFGGTGLGLAISRDLARLMDGSLHCVSEEGVGSTFTLSAPLRSAATRSSSPAKAAGVAIIVDEGLGRVKLKVSGAVSGAEVAEALVVMLTERPELVGFDMVFDLLDYSGDVASDDLKPVAQAYARGLSDPVVPCRSAFLTTDVHFGCWAAAMDHQFPGREHRAFASLDEVQGYLAAPIRRAAA